MKIFPMMLAVALLVGCSVRTPGASVSIGTGWGYDDGYYRGDRYHGDYYERDRHPHDAGNFCPPGQAKKGRC
ncbi:hypothetical protein CR155_06100 [Pollutimonas nitritireducens]|uniref:Lipoprotein n=1 Tax=Pollutimonas nitritireducens TaxID=2045209 RepID=A0A2N4UJ30_9BURK|nr:hypothetical protein CR155_06100 [Pollutimonas nitritireducens]